MTKSNPNTPAVFQFQSQEIRVIVKDGEPWFVAADVCAAIGLKNVTEALRNLDDDERSNFKLGQSEMTLSLTEGQKKGRGGAQSVNIISESGMYALVLRSRDAMKKGTVQHSFRKWVTSEVLPSIRKTGGYSRTTSDERTGLRQAVTMLTTKRGLMHDEAYRIVHQRFNVEHIEEIPREKLTEAVEYVHKLVLQGELLPPKESRYTEEEARNLRVKGIYLMASGLMQYEEQSDQIHKAWTMAADMAIMAERILALLGAATHNGGRVYTALSEAQFKVCHDSDERTEGRKLAEQWFATR